MFFRFQSIIFMLIGIICLVFAKKIADFMLSFLQSHKFNKPPYKSLLYIWPIRFIGILCLGFSFLIFTSGPSSIFMNSDKIRIDLLERGETIQAKIQKCYFQHLAPEGWKVIYEFAVEDTETHKGKTFFGSSQGPKKYYYSLSEGDTLDVIYNPQNPNINCEVSCFLNHPSHRNTFEKAEKLNLLEKFRDHHKMEDYSFKEWYRQQQMK